MINLLKEMVTIPDYISNLVKYKNMSIYEHSRRHKYKAFTIVFKKPVLYKGFRVVARYPGISVNERGDILNNKTSRIRKREDILKFNKKYENYPFIYIYDKRLGYSAKVYMHILVGSTWCENSDYANKTIIDHIADKNDFHADNLQWVSYSENTKLYYDRKDGDD